MSVLNLRLHPVIHAHARVTVSLNEEVIFDNNQFKSFTHVLNSLKDHSGALELASLRDKTFCPFFQDNTDAAG